MMMMQRCGPSLAVRPSVSAARVTPAVVAPRRSTACRVAAKRVGGVEKFANDIGLPTEEGLFGFTPFAENWCGRLAMMGFIISIVEEGITGNGTLRQIGIYTPSLPLLVLLGVVFGGATVAGTVQTVQRASAKKLSRREIDRYKSFLGLLKEKDEISAAAAAMKGKPSGLSPAVNMAEIEQAKAAGTPVDAFLSTNELQEGQQASAEMKAASRQSQAEASNRQSDVMYFGANAELAYARSVELSNGRWAMVGFLAAVLVEAATGQGIIGQLIMIFKAVGLLGEKSGF